MANSLLVIPVQLDVLRLESEMRVAGPLLDFTRLPWRDSPGDKDSPYLSETLAAEDFEDQHRLQRGLHFHWSLPPALTKTSSLGFVYRQSFQSAFGKGPQPDGGMSGDDIWDYLVHLDWLRPISAAIGLARTNLPAEADQLAQLQSDLPDYAQTIHKLLHTSVFPPVPDRWLLSRVVDGQVQSIKLVESNYVWPAGQHETEDGRLSELYTVYPQITADPQEQPYRYLGRAIDLERASPDNDPADYLDGPLTAAGYGEPAFAAFYPLCRSVFGHYDPQPPAAGEQYELIGFYHDPAQDYFRLFVDAFTSNWQAEHQTDAAEGIHQQYQQTNYLYLDLLDALYRQLRLEVAIVVPQEALEAIAPDADAPDGGPQNAWDYLRSHLWIDAQGRLLPKAYTMTTVVGAPFQSRADDIRRTLSAAISDQMPQHSICYARYAGDGHSDVLPEVAADQVKIALGNSPTEALAALLASEISTAKQSLIEDQLEAFQFAATLDQTTVDAGALFEARRHEKQFHHVPGGQRWRIKAKKPADQKAGAAAEDPAVSLSAELANALNRLNSLEEDKDQNAAAIDSLRRQIYADWCWYLKLESSLKKMSAAPVFEDPSSSSSSTGFGDGDGFGDGGGDGFGDGGAGFGDEVGSGAGEDQPPAATADPNPAAEAQATEFLAGFKGFITAEIDGQLATLISRTAALDGAIEQQYNDVQLALLHYQSESQFLLASDIVDWDAFTALLAQKAPTLVDPAAAQSHAAYLRAVNDRLAAGHDLLPWPDATEATDEYQALLTQLAAADLPPFFRDGLILRANRLALEAQLAGVIKHRPALELTAEAAARFWRANDPVVLISGFDPTPRYQAVAEAQPAHLLPFDPADFSDESGALIDSTMHLLDLLRPVDIVTADSPHWHPLFLSWDVAFSQAHQVENETYAPTYLQDNFRLGNNDFLTAQPPPYDKPISFYGRTILTPAASLSLKNTLIERLGPRLYQQFVDESVAPTPGQVVTLPLFNDYLRRLDPQIADLPVDDPDAPAEQQIRQWLADELDRQNDTDDRLARHLPATLSADSRQPIIRQFLAEQPGADLSANIDAFLEWATTHSHIKTTFAAGHRSQLDGPLDIALIDQADVRQAFVEQLQATLGDNLQRYYATTGTPADRQADYPNDHYDDLIAWYQPQVSEALSLVVEIRAYLALLNVRGLAQAMAGFGDALIMRHQAFQLPVYNPFPHDDDQTFAARVRAAVQTANKVAPNENLPFSPWRAGKITLTELELLDNFGRYWPTDPDSRGTGLAEFPTLAADTLPDVGATPGQEFAVPPRLAQPAGLAFRWLAAHDEIEEMNDLPVANPICGWVVPNHLDNSLLIYTSEGRVLGTVDADSRWRTFPGNRGPIIPADIANPHLARLVQWLCDQGQDFLADFLSALDIAQENMEPESYAQHQALALLMGRPLALVRADARLQLQEPPAVNVSQIQMQADVEAWYAYQTGGAHGPPPARHTFDFERVQVPLRLGEFHRLNDGLAGYWLEDDKGDYAADTFYALQTDPTPGLSARIQTRHLPDSEDQDESRFLLCLSFDETRKITMLLDPRAPVHATTGVVPVAALAIPQEQYAAALQRMQVAFLTAPVLAPALGLELSLPTEPGFDWSWLQLDGQQWSAISAQGLIGRHQLRDLFGPGVEVVWAALLQAGWLEALTDTTARIVAEDKRTQADLPPALAQAQEAVELLFHRLRIRPFDATARFDERYQLREGWLRLSPSPT